MIGQRTTRVYCHVPPHPLPLQFTKRKVRKLGEDRGSIGQAPFLAVSAVNCVVIILLARLAEVTS